MASGFTLRTVTDYLALPELEIPAVPDEGLYGRICQVLAVDFYIALKSDCALHGIEAMDIPNLYRCALPTAVVHEDHEAVFFRLPHSLSSWAFEVVGRGANEAPLFPAHVDFGILRDQHYARFL